MRDPANNLRLYRFCGLVALMLTLISGAMASTGSPDMWFIAAIGCAESLGFGLIVARCDPAAPPPAQGRDRRDEVKP